MSSWDVLRRASRNGKRTLSILFCLCLFFPLTYSTTISSKQFVSPDNSSHGPFPRIIGGYPAKDFVVRHMAHIIVKFVHNGFNFTKPIPCTATVVAGKWLMTAAHCFVGTDSFNFSVLDTYAFVGEANARLRLENTHKKPHWVKLVLVHKDYKPRTADHRNDIALVKLDRSVNLSRIIPVNLARSSNREAFRNKMVHAAGYGVLNNEKTLTDKLMETKLVVKPFNICAERSGELIREFIQAEKQLCAVSPGFPQNGTTDTCGGDSGGPLFLHDSSSNYFFQFGITSFGTTKFCAHPGSVAWYTRISHFYEVIQEALFGNNKSWKIYS